jgi:hypothetical protein
MLSELQNNSKPILLVIIIILSIIIGYATYTHFNNNQEGMKNIFSALMCPIRILKNIDKCMIFWLKDVFWLIIHLIIKYMLLFPFVYIPIKSILKTICFCTGKCYNVTLEDVTPDKKSFFKLIENLKTTISNGRYLYRNSGDIKKCYCVPSIKKMFDPLTQYRSFKDAVSNQQSQGVNTSIFIVPMIILGILYAGNKMRSSSPSTGVSGISNIMNSLSNVSGVGDALPMVANPLASVP